MTHRASAGRTRPIRTPIRSHRPSPRPGTSAPPRRRACLAQRRAVRFVLRLATGCVAVGWAVATAAAPSGSDPLAPPAAWPAEAPTPHAVVDAATALHDRTEALRLQAEGVVAELRFRPRAHLLWRDDPPRPLDPSFDGAPEARVVWSPLASEVLLAEARVIEAEAALQDAWRDAVVDAWAAPVAAARTLADLHAAEGTLVRAEADAEAARATLRKTAREAGRPDLASVPASVDAAARDGDLPEALRTARLAAVAAELDRRAAALRAREARDAAEPWFAYRPPGEAAEFGIGWARLAGWDPASEPPPELDAEARSELALPAPPDPRGLRAYAARTARTEAVVSRADRNRLGAVVPAASFEAGYAGTSAELSAELGVRSGRPRVELGGSLDGTVQERFWLRAGVTVRLGSDLDAAVRDAERARADQERTLRELAASLRTEAAERTFAAETAAERWRLAEERRVLARLEGTEAQRRRAEDDARRRWLQYLTAAHRAWTRTESPPGRAPAGGADR